MEGDGDASDDDGESSLDGIFGTTTPPAQSPAAPKSAQRETNLNIITRKVALFKQHYIALSRLGKNLSCYAQDCVHVDVSGEQVTYDSYY